MESSSIQKLNPMIQRCKLALYRKGIKEYLSVLANLFYKLKSVKNLKKRKKRWRNIIKSALL